MGIGSALLLARTLHSQLLTGVSAGIGNIAVIDDGDAALSSGGGTSTVTFSAQTSTGPTSVICITWYKATTATTLSSITWNGSAMSILEQINRDAGSDTMGAAIAIIDGAQSGDVVATFAASVSESEITKLSLTNVQSLTAVDTDEEGAAAGGSDLAALTSPGLGGVRIAAFANLGSAVAVTWSNATEVSDLDAGTYRHSVAYDLGDDATTIVATGGSNDEVHVGVSLR